MKTRYQLLVWAVVSIFLGVGQCMAGQQVAFTLPSGVRIEIVEAAFHKTSFSIFGCGANDPVCLINGQVPFGTDLELPKTYVRGITASYRGRSYSLDATNMYNAWGERPLAIKGIRYFGGKCFDTKNCEFRGIFSDAAGSFVAEWRIVGGVSVRTVLTNSSDVVNLFIRHIDPPDYE